MTGPDLIRLAEELARCGGVHRLTSLVTAAVHVCLEHERRRPRTVERWEDEPHGVGMSDEILRVNLDAVARFEAEHGSATRPPAAEEPSGRAAEAQDGRGPSTATPDGLRAIELYRAARYVADGLAERPACRCGETPLVNPHPVMPERGERISLRTGNALTDEACVSPVSSKAGCVSDRSACEPQGGIVHMPGSKVAAEFGPSDPARRCVPRPVNPEDCGDGA